MRMGLRWLLVGSLLWALAWPSGGWASAAEATPKKIVLIAGKKSHGPEGNGIHDYPWSVKLLKTLLDNSNVRDAVRVEFHLDGWPRDPTTLDTADAIMVISDGRDGDLYEEAPHFANEAQLALVERQMRRGCGFLTFHFSTFAPDKYSKQIVDWSGGYFDWETDGQRKWYSAIKVLEDEVGLGSPEHPVSRGVRPFRLKEEFYYNLRFGEGDQALRPLLVVPGLGGRETLGNVVAWCRERPDGGRGFGTTCGHFYDNWRNDDFRRLILNALVWAARAEVPAGGVQSRFYERDEIVAALEGKQGTERAAADDKPLRVLIVAGNEAHKWHNWEKTTPAIQRALEADPRVRVDISYDIEDLSVKKLSEYQVLVQNYVNWHDPRGISEASRAALVGFVRQGGGLVLVHFANGAFHFSLPQAGASDWPEYRKLARRVWNHQGEGEKKGGHDAFGVFTVRPTEVASPLTKGLAPFEVTDELYFRQDGEDPIEPLLVAKSKVTGRDEPLAWVYSYGEGRVFQTLLGHSEKTYDTFEPCEMLRRAVAWTAKRVVVSRPAPPGTARVSAAPPAVPAPTPTPAPTRVALVEGRFGKGLDARQHGLLVAAKEAQRTAPLTVEAWVKLDHKRGFQILVASEEKSSPTHWELYSYAESGVLSVYMPGRGGEYRSEVDVCDARWHHVAMVLEEARLRLLVDAKLALDRPLPRENASRAGETVLAVGRLVEGGLGCAGTIDELRLTRAAAPPAAVPEGPARVEANTVGLWRFDDAGDGKSVPDESTAKLPARLTSGAASPANSRANARPVVGALADHWGVDSVGFNWTEADSRDDRWKAMKLGTFQASSLPLPGSPLRKGLSIQLGSPPRAYVAFDTEFLRWRAAWTGDFLAFDPARYGLIAPPRPAGPLIYSTREGAGWGGGAEGEFVGLRVHGERVTLISRVGATELRESPWVEDVAGRMTFVRTVELSANAPELITRQFDLADGEKPKLLKRGELRVVAIPRGTGWLAAAVGGPGLAWKVANDGTGVDLALAASGPPRRFQIRLAAVSDAELSAWVEGVAQSKATESLDELAQPGPARWTEKIVTRGERSPNSGPYVLDTLTLPHKNPYNALFFLGGHDFLPNGDLVVCTAHGDVWRVSGVDESLERLEWRRFATGLFQPLGLKVSGGEVYVLGKDQITRLVDHNGDGEADEYACVNNRAFTSYGGHDYVTCLEQSPDGWFYFAHATQGLVRAAPDGKRFEVIATGFRNPNGMGLGPNGELTVAPQEGEWVPGSNIALVKPGGYYGYGGPRVTPERSLGYDAPLLFLPRMVDNSSGAQTWITSEQWGPLRGMLHVSFGKCRLLHVVRETVEGPTIPAAPASREQGGTVAFPFTFASGAHRGRFSPRDGQLYVAGLKGWVSSAVEDGCLQRVRYTGAPVDQPERVECRANGMAITFTRPLDRSSAEDPENYGVEQWNYRYAAAYGSADWKVSDGREEGHDRLEVLSATLLDERTVFLELDPLRPSNQVEVRYSLRALDGREIRDTLNYTVHAVRAERMATGRLKRPMARASELDPQQRARLKPGVAWEFQSLARNATAHGGSVGRLLALAIPAGGAPTSEWPAASAFQGTGRAFLDAPVRGRYEFRLEGQGHALVRVGGQLVATMGNVTLPATNRASDDAAGAPESAGQGRAAASSVDLHKGWNKIELAVLRATNEPLEVRVLWRGEGFSWEPIPSVALAHLPRVSNAFVVREVEQGKLKAEETASRLEHAGWWSVGRLHCLRCHDAAPPASAAATAPRKPADGTATVTPSFADWANREAPSLANAGRRFETAWLHAWILDPRQHRPDATMPRLIDSDSAGGRQAAADLVAYLATLAGSSATPTPSPTGGNPASTDAAQRNAGLALYEELGCIACHRRTPDVAEHEPTPPRISLAGVGGKFRPGEIAEFLLRPTAHDPWRKMPDFRLSREEAQALEAWLRAETEGATAAPRAVEMPVGDAGRGAQRFADFRCDACHATGAQPAPRKVQPWGTTGSRLQLDRGCLAKPSTPAGAAPRWALTDDERAELSLWLLRGRIVPQHLAAMEASRYFASELRCLSCHSRDGQTSPRGLLTIEEGERGLPAETLPNLSWAGDKLRSAYFERLVRGREPSARAWLKARMPGFDRYAAWLAQGIAAEHGYLPSEPESSTVNSELARLGDRLTQKDALDCRQCHAVGQDKPRGDANTQIALGINFDLVRERVRPGYYSRFLLNPPRFDVGTKMPVLAPDGKTTRVTQILDGDAVRQFDAIWQFIQSRPPRAERSAP